MGKSRLQTFWRENWLIILSLVYIFSPVDLIPEFIAGPLGLVDDGVVALTMFAQVAWRFLRPRTREA